MQRRGQGTTFLELSGAALASLPVSLPTRAYQVAVADYLDRETAEIDAFIADQEKLIELLTERNASTISAAVTCGLRTPSGARKTRVAWPSEVPTSWINTSIRHAFRVLDCKHLTAEFTADGEYPLASIREVKGKFVDLSRAKRTTESNYQLLSDGERAPRAGDLIVSRNASVGEVALVPPGLPPFAMGQDVSLIRDTSPVGRTTFLYYVLQSKIGRDAFSVASVGSTFKRINVDDIKAINFWIPADVEEMQEIVTYLDRETASIDAAIADAREAIALSKERRAALISAAVTGKIDVREHGRANA